MPSMPKAATATRPSQRSAALLAARNRKMARSAHAYVRGNTLRFYEWLDSIAPSSLPEGPAIWICGDCHVSNLGPVANLQGRVDIQIRDFDQTVIGNPVHDLIRLGLSLASAARGSDLPGVTTALMLEQMIDGYASAFVRGKRKVAPADVPEVVAQAFCDARARTWRHLARERVEGATDRIPLGKRFWPVSKHERGCVVELVQQPEVLQLITQMHHRPDGAQVEFLDVAYWKKGCSSLGRLRYAVLLDVAGRASSGRDLCLLDIKEAAKAAAPRYRDAPMPRDNALRVVQGARALAPNLGERMAAARFMERAVFMRELLPEDLKLELSVLTVDQAVRVSSYLAWVVGMAHARQMDAATRKDWHAVILRKQSKALEAPSWLWSSVADLMAGHERGYLEHCRRYALKLL